MDGWVIVGTKLDTKQLDKDLKNAERKLKQYEKEATNLTEKKATIKTNIEIDEKEYKQKIEALNQKYNAELQANTKWGMVQNQGKIDAKYDQLRLKLDNDYGNSLDQNNYKLEEINKKIKENAENQALVTKEIKETNAELQKSRGYDDIQRNVDNIGRGTSNIISKVGRWALAIFSVRSAYSFVTQSMSILSQYNQQIGTDIEYIRYSLASMLKPIIEGMIQLVYKLLSYVNYIAQAWFGVNLFANASTKAFGKVNKAIGGSVSQAKELKKTLTGFDEMNILQENGNVKTGGGGGGISGLEPLEDLGKIPNEVPKWIQWIADNKELILGIGGALATFFGVNAISKILNNIAKLFTGGGAGFGLTKLIGTLGLIAGTAILVTIAIKGIKEAKKQLDELKVSLDSNTKGLENNKNKASEVVRKYENLIETNKITNRELQLYNKYLNESVTGGIAMVEQLESQKTWLGAITGTNKELNEQIKEVTSQVTIELQAYKKLYDQGLLNDKQQQDYKRTLESVMDYLAKQGIEVEELQKDYEKLTGKKYNINVNADTGQANKKLDKLKDRLNKLGNSSISVSISGMVHGGGSLKFAKGGIVNLPGRGVPVANAIMGEAGQEGIIPLTDTRQMQILGQAIGRYITVNASITNTMNGRVISKELQKISGENDFATNR